MCGYVPVDYSGVSLNAVLVWCDLRNVDSDD